MKTARSPMPVKRSEMVLGREQRCKSPWLLYRPELDVLRFLAFLSVFTVHRMDHLPIDPSRHFWAYNICLLGNIGVPVFFLLSAFLITELLMREVHQSIQVANQN